MNLQGIINIERIQTVTKAEKVNKTVNIDVGNYSTYNITCSNTTYDILRSETRDETPIVSSTELSIEDDLDYGCSPMSCKVKHRHRDQHCYCDNICPILGDCCADYSNTISSSEDSEYFFPNTPSPISVDKSKSSLLNDIFSFFAETFRDEAFSNQETESYLTSSRDNSFERNLDERNSSIEKVPDVNTIPSKTITSNVKFIEHFTKETAIEDDKNTESFKSLHKKSLNVTQSQPFESIEHSFLVMMTHYGSCHEMPKIGNFTIIASCPKDYPHITTRWKCAESRKVDIRNIAASLNRKDLPIIFRNKHCARCHGISSNDLIFWNSTLHCSHNVTKDESMETIERKCEMIQLPPHELPHPRKCFKTDIHSCPSEKDEREHERCHMFYQPGHLPGMQHVVYKNKYCARCNGFSKEQDFKMKCVEENIQLGSTIHNYVPSKLGITFLFSFDNDFVMLKSKFGEKFSIPTCDIGQSYNSIVRRCMDIKCPSHFKLENDRCKSMYEKYTSPLECDPPMLHLLVHMSDGKRTNGPEEGAVLVFLEDDTNCSVVLQENNLTSLHKIQLISREKRDDREILAAAFKCIEYFQRKEKNISNGSSEIIVKTFGVIHHLDCPQGVLKTKQFNISADINFDKLLEIVVLIDDSNKSLALGHFHFRIRIKGNDSRIIDVWFCDNNSTVTQDGDDCSIFFAYEDFHIKGEEAEVTAFNLTFETDEFHIENGTLYSCVHERNKTKPRKLKLMHVMDNVLTACFSVSVFSLILVSVIYCVLRDLRNLHGKCMISFSVSLAFAHTLWILQGYLPLDFCRPLAIILHYIWLCVFMWTGVMAYDLARKLNMWTILNSRRSNDQKVFLIYSLVSWICPALIVGTCFVLDEISKNRMIGYGSGVRINNICWIYNSSARLFAFILPCGTILLLNFGFLVVVICGLESARRATRNVKKNQKEISRCLVYTKISVMVGVTWVLAYISSATRSNWIDGIYNVLNSMQGVLVLLGVLCNCRIMKMLCQKMSIKVKIPSSRTASSLDTRL